MISYIRSDFLKPHKSAPAVLEKEESPAETGAPNTIAARLALLRAGGVNDSTMESKNTSVSLGMSVWEQIGKRSS